MLELLGLFFVGFLSAVEAMPVYQAAYYASQESSNLVYGDIMLTDQQKLLKQLPESASSKLFIIDGESHRWPNSVVPFEFSSKHTKEDEKKLRHAMKLIEGRTCFKFVERTSAHKDYLMFEPSGSCFSYVGRIGGKQIISLYGWCADPAPAVHDIIHALGAHHEHQRPDRDQHITVNIDNADPSMKWVYEKVSQNLDAKRFPYDLKSIMHYHGSSYARVENGRSLVTMTVKGTKTPVPYNTVMSQEDIHKLIVLGKCDEKGSSQHRTSKHQPATTKSSRRKQSRRRRH